MKFGQSGPRGFRAFCRSHFPSWFARTDSRPARRVRRVRPSVRPSVCTSAVRYWFRVSCGLLRKCVRVWRVRPVATSLFLRSYRKKKKRNKWNPKVIASIFASCRNIAQFDYYDASVDKKKKSRKNDVKTSKTWNLIFIAKISCEWQNKIHT